MRRLGIYLLLVAAIGCAKPAETPPPATDTTPPKKTAAIVPQNQGIAPMGSVAAGPMTPVSGTDSVEGAGMGGIGQVAKDKARNAAGIAGAPAGADSLSDQ